jgi:hypothetical protein
MACPAARLTPARFRLPRLTLAPLSASPDSRARLHRRCRCELIPAPGLAPAAVSAPWIAASARACMATQEATSTRSRIARDAARIRGARVRWCMATPCLHDCIMHAQPARRHRPPHPLVRRRSGCFLTAYTLHGRAMHPYTLTEGSLRGDHPTICDISNACAVERWPLDRHRRKTANAAPWRMHCSSSALLGRVLPSRSLARAILLQRRSAASRQDHDSAAAGCRGAVGKIISAGAASAVVQLAVTVAPAPWAT